jgi:hypothetical protein
MRKISLSLDSTFRRSVRFEGNLELRQELFKDLYLNVRFFDSFDNRARAPRRRPPTPVAVAQKG